MRNTKAEGRSYFHAKRFPPPHVYPVALSPMLVPHSSPRFATVITPVYLRELAPPSLRGTFGAMSGFTLAVGIHVCSLLAFALSNAAGWRYLFAVTPIVAVVVLICMPLALESPRSGHSAPRNS